MPCSVPFHEVFEDVLESGFSFVAANLAHPRCCIEAHRRAEMVPFSIADRVMSSRNWELGVVGVISPWIDIDSDDETLAALSEQELRAELNYFDYLCVAGIMLELRKPCVNLARFLNGYLLQSMKSRNMKVYVRVPLLASADDVDPWEWWSLLMNMCDQQVNISAVIEIGVDLPDDSKIVDRWCGEMVEAIYVKQNVFTSGTRSDQPQMSLAHVRLLEKMFDHVDHVFVECEDPLADTGGGSSYADTINRIWQHFRSLGKPYRIYEHYRDVVQIPLEPLGDNLRSETYEVFEGDRVKYRMYEEAFEKAVLDRYAGNLAESIVVMVVGAGRGPLVSVVLKVLAALRMKGTEVYAIEKNPNAVVSLSHANATHWSNRVKVIEGDMRSMDLPVKADIMISELLGSFGDNELSPECLDGAMHLLKEDGISIPCCYESFVSPAHAAKVMSQMASLAGSKGRADFVSFETMIVAKLHSHFVVSPPKSVFRFVHPNRDKLSNSRHKRILFEASMDCVLGGFAGYFRATLYDDICLSTVPEDHTPNMESWFAMWIPLQHPIQLRKNDTIELHIWRFSTQEKVWYEWSVTRPVLTCVHNPNGRTSHIRLFSSEIP
uniref:Protein arginine N-methyltransferase n=1 Tax=Trichuris muris TaxID=70415 RepID=A0A5S6QDW6_TRIMR